MIYHKPIIVLHSLYSFSAHQCLKGKTYKVQTTKAWCGKENTHQITHDQKYKYLLVDIFFTYDKLIVKSKKEIQTRLKSLSHTYREREQTDIITKAFSATMFRTP